MSMKASAVAPANIAFIKYWGKKDESLRLPENGSISINLNNLQTTTTVEFLPSLQKDSIIINGQQNLSEIERVIKHLDLIRKIAKLDYKAKVVSVNNFPSSVGLSSSSSGFASLTLAATAASGLKLSEKKLSIIARQGSGSACRSIPNGFVEWRKGNSSGTSYARSIYSQDYWDIVDVVTIVSVKKKIISSTQGQTLAKTSPFFKTRLLNIEDKIAKIKKLIAVKNFSDFGKLIEEEALELHAVMLTSSPPLIYWLPETLKIMRLVEDWRRQGLEVFFTINTGQDIHLIIENKNLDRLIKQLKKVKEVKIIINHPAKGARLTDNHLF